MNPLAAGAIAAVAGAAISLALVRVGIASAPARLMRTNVSGARVPAVLGDGVAAGGVVGTSALLLVDGPGDRILLAAALALVIAVMWAAGKADDLRGHERDRGFRGHLRAAARGRLTGGVLKIVAGAACGLAAGALTTSGPRVVIVGLTVALGANLFNLLDRAPGRAGKFWIVAMLPLLAFGPAPWAAGAAGTFGAVAGSLPADLSERAMLGDSGANPMGAVWGLGLALSLDAIGGMFAVAALVALNGSSERWSFSAIIRAVPVLRAFDRVGRK